MYNRLELGIKVDQLFKLEAGQFNPMIHLSLAEEIVGSLGIKPYLLKLADFWHIVDSELFGIEIRGENIGSYSFKHKGILISAAYYGFFQKLRFTPSIAYATSDFTRPFEDLILCYDKNKKVRSVIRNREADASFINIPFLGEFGSHKVERIWEYRV